MASFTLTTWNILADAYIRPGRYPKTPPAALEPAARRRQLLDSLVGLGSDIVCLQEVERPVFEVISQRMEPLGYEWRYCPKGNGAPDGCATGLRTAAFALLGHERLEFEDGRAGKNSGHVAQLLELEYGHSRLVVANTHLRWCSRQTPPEDHLGRHQLALLLARLSDVAPDRPAVICGDFNLPLDDAAASALGVAGLRSALPPLPTANFDGKPLGLDHICCPREWRSEAAPRTAITASTVLPSAAVPSDHVPVSARLEPSQTTPVLRTRMPAGDC